MTRIISSFLLFLFILSGCSSTEALRTEAVFYDNPFERVRVIEGLQESIERDLYKDIRFNLRAVHTLDTTELSESETRLDIVIETTYISDEIFKFSKAELEGGTEVEILMSDGESELNYGTCCKIRTEYVIEIPNEYWQELEGDDMSFLVRMRAEEYPFEVLIFEVSHKQIDEITFAVVSSVLDMVMD